MSARMMNSTTRDPSYTETVLIVDAWIPSAAATLFVNDTTPP